LDDVFGALEIGDIAADSKSFTAGPFDLLDQLVCLSATRTVVHGYVRALSGQGQRDCSTDSTRGARYQSDLTLKLHDKCPPTYTGPAALLWTPDFVPEALCVSF